MSKEEHATPCLEEFRRKRQEWLHCLKGHDTNSLFSQVQNMLWCGATFHMLNEARKKLAPSSRDHHVELNGLLCELIDGGFVALQVLSIRRLTDSGYKLIDTKKGIYSLPSLINDLSGNICLLTRENILGVEVLSRPGHADGVQDKVEVERREKEIDVLAGASLMHRRSDDQVRLDVLGSLLEMLLRTSKETANIREYSMKFLAHAASPDSRNRTKIDDITLGDLHKAQETICRVFNFVGTYLLPDQYPVTVGCPQTEPSWFHYLDRPLVAEQDVGEMEKTWKSYWDDTKQWGGSGVEAMLEQLRKPGTGTAE